MVFWNEIDLAQIETVALNKDRTRFRYQGGPLRFQVPRGACSGVNAFKSLQVELIQDEFAQWWRTLEGQLCPHQTPFNSNLRAVGGSAHGTVHTLRLKIDDSVYVFDKYSKQINPEVREGLFRGQDVSCLIDVDTTYFFNGNWGLTIRLYQIKTLTDAPPSLALIGSSEEEETRSFSFPKGACAFLSLE